MKFMSEVKELLFEKQKSWTHGYIGGEGPAAAKGKEYITISVHSLWISVVRELFIEKYGAVHGSVSVPHQGKDEKRTFQVFNPLVDGKAITKEDLNSVIIGPYYILKSVPYYGGTVDIDISLFSVEAENLAEPYIKILKKLSDVSGIPVVTQAIDVIETVENGVAELIGDKSLLIGRQGSQKRLPTGFYGVMRKKKGDEFSLEECKYDAKHGKILFKNKDVEDYPYFVLEISTSATKDFWNDVADVQTAFLAMKEQFLKTPTDYAQNMEAYIAFRSAIVASPDLFPMDAMKKAKDVYESYKIFLEPDTPAWFVKPGVQPTYDGKPSDGLSRMLNKSLEDIGDLIK